ncbi:hypothetical protein NKG05_29650 [Oerskovia sp. M15]
MTFTDERGEQTLDAPATEVVSLEWGLTENLLALGVDVVGQADVVGYNTWDVSVPLDASTPDVGMRGRPASTRSQRSSRTSSSSPRTPPTT